MFCKFTCSPDQSLFVNVTQQSEKSGKFLVDELDQLISKDYGTGFYDSCKEVKFSGSNGRVMDLIGGGAKEYTGMLKFLGTKRTIGGSPFQINFPTEYSDKDMHPLDMKHKKCNDEDPDYRCVCVDCPEVCPELPEVKKSGSCHVGLLPCLSFASIFTYLVLLFALFTLGFGHVAWKKYAQRRAERTRLLHEASHSDDEDEGGPVQTEAMRDRPTGRYWVNDRCDKAFYQLGHFAARFPAITIGACLVVVAVLSAGWFRFDLETEPARLWVSPSSAAAQEKAYFDSNFGPFYRAEKIFLVNDTNGDEISPVLSYETIKWWMDVEKSVLQLKGPEYSKRLDDICFKPTGDACVIQSVTAYFEAKGGITRKSWNQTLNSCASQPVDCRPDFGQPIEPTMILGGYEGTNYGNAKAITTTWVVRNAEEGTEHFNHAVDWEKAMRDKMLEVQQEAADRGLRLSFNTEMSLEQELNKSTNTDAKIVVISYIVMFIYACLALGTPLKHIFRNPAVLLVESKVTLGLVGIIIVLMSIAASIGFFSWVGLKATLIIVEVIPFIVLAVGVDNIFLIVHELERVNISCPDHMVEERVARALGRMGPSILFSALTETVAFALGAAVGMPAVRNFAAYAAGAVLVNAVLQMTMFVSFLALNQMRVEDHRCELWPWWQIKKARVHLNGNNSYATGRASDVDEESILQVFIKNVYAPKLMGHKVKLGVITIFLGLFAAAIALLPGIQLGLDQRVAIPDGSYLIPYFNDLYDYMETGPPVYFVTRGVDATQREQQQQLCSRFLTCQSLSVTNTLELERQRPGDSYIAASAASWMDDFFTWLDPENDRCCIEDGKPCFEGRQPPWNRTLWEMPEGDEFVHYLQKFLKSPTDDECPIGGQAAYSDAVTISYNNQSVEATHFRTAHVPLRSQEDFINAYSSARRVAAEITASTGADVFPYSVFYIFFDQYLSIVPLTAGLLSAAVGIIFVVATVLLGSALTSAVVSLTVVMSVIDIMGAMSVFGVSLNAVSLVNLIICVGISVEFCAHIARAFMFPSRTVLESNTNGLRGRDARAWTALVNVGGSVFSGITVTKLLGVCVLAFTRSKIFEIYYFRVWLSLVIFAALHALVFLPVALSIAGGHGYVDPESEGTAAQDLTDRRWRAIRIHDQSDSDEDY